MRYDRLGRRRGPDQERGLRPLHPPLPDEWTSKAIRVSMSELDWARFESLAYMLSQATPTMARAYGLALTALMDSANLPNPVSSPTDWMDWERRKTLRLLRYAP
ncbi:MAG: hypothetical protein U0790_11380 [Isosphaeraceae bacterium]